MATRRIGMSLMVAAMAVLFVCSVGSAQSFTTGDPILNQLWREFRFGTGQALALTPQGAAQAGTLNLSGQPAANTGNTGNTQTTGNTGTATGSGTATIGKNGTGFTPAWNGTTKCLDPWKRSSSSANNTTTGTGNTTTVNNNNGINLLTMNTLVGNQGNNQGNQMNVVQPAVNQPAVQPLVPDLAPVTIVVRTNIGAPPPTQSAVAGAVANAPGVQQVQTGSGVINFVPGPAVGKAAPDPVDSGFSRFMDIYQSPSSAKPTVTRTKVSSGAAKAVATPARKTAPSAVAAAPANGGGPVGTGGAAANQGVPAGTVQPNVQPSNIPVVSGSTPGVIDGRSSRGRGRR